MRRFAAIIAIACAVSGCSDDFERIVVSASGKETVLLKSELHSKDGTLFHSDPIGGVDCRIGHGAYPEMMIVCTLDEANLLVQFNCRNHSERLDGVAFKLYSKDKPGQRFMIWCE